MAPPYAVARFLLISALAAVGCLSGCGGKGGDPLSTGGGGTTGTGTHTGTGGNGGNGGNGGVPTGDGEGGADSTCPTALDQPVCTYGAKASCYEGDPGTEGTGSCHAGTRICSGSAFGPCDGEGLPAPATCAAPTVFTCGAAPACGAPAFQVIPPPPQDTSASGTAVAIDPQGNILAASSAGPASSITLAKLDPTGAAVWSKTFATSGSTATRSAWIQRIALGADGRLILVGYVYNAAVDFGGGLLSGNGSMAIVVELDAAGNHLWSKAFSAVTAPTPPSAPPFVGSPGVAVDGAGNVYLAGSFGIENTLDPTQKVTVDLGGGPLEGVAGGTAFVAKLDASGNHVWSKTASGPVGAWASAVALDGAGNVYVTGASSHKLFPDDVCTYPALLLASYDSTGAVRWSKSFGDGSAGGSGTDIAVGPSGDLFLSGSIGGALDLGGGFLGEGAFAARFDPSGAHVWSKPVAAGEAPIGLGLDGAGNVVAFTQGFHLMKIRPNGIPFASRLQKHTANSFSALASPGAFAVGASGNVVLTGSYQGQVDFGLGDTPEPKYRNAFVLAIDP